MAALMRLWREEVQKPVPTTQSLILLSGMVG